MSIKLTFSILLSLVVLFLTGCQPATATISNPTTQLPTNIPTSPPPSATATQSPTATLFPTSTDIPAPTETATEVPTLAPSDILGIWERITDEHGNEYLSFGEDGTLVYAEGRAENVTELPSITGSYTLETGILSLQTEDCPEVTGTYTIRLLGSKFLKFEILEDTCEGRGDNLTLQPWERYEE